MQNKWICTDPDQLQFCREISFHEYEFSQFDDFYYPEEFEKLKSSVYDKEDYVPGTDYPGKYWITKTIDIRDYPDEDILEYIKAFGYKSIPELKEIYPIEYNLIIAECIFEMTFYE